MLGSHTLDPLGRNFGFFLGGANRLLGFGTANPSAIRAFAASSSCLSASYKNNGAPSPKTQLVPLAKIVSKLQSPTSGNGVLSKQVVRQMSATGDHVTLWTAEKVVSGALVAIVPLAFIFPSAMMDYLLAFSITIHSHWGIEAIVLDYIRPSIFGAVIPKISLAAVYLLSALTLGGLFYFTYTDVGIVNAIKMLWKL